MARDMKALLAVLEAARDLAQAKVDDLETGISEGVYEDDTDNAQALKRNNDVVSDVDELLDMQRKWFIQQLNTETGTVRIREFDHRPTEDDPKWVVLAKQGI